MASGCADNTIKIWNIDTGSLIRTLLGHTGYVESLAVLPNGFLASGDFNGIIKIWNIITGSLTRTLAGHTDWVTSLGLLPNGFLVSGSYDTKIKIWNTNNEGLKDNPFFNKLQH